MNLSPTDENDATLVENRPLLEDDRSLIKKYGKGVFAYLDVIRLIAAGKIDIFKPDVHRKILLNSLFHQLFDSLSRHLAAAEEDEEEGEEGQSFDGQSIQETLQKALEVDNQLFGDFKLDFGFDDGIVTLPKTIDRNQNGFKCANKENESKADEPPSGDDLSSNNSSDDSEAEYQSCVDLTVKFNGDNGDTAQNASQKKSTPKERPTSEDEDEDLFFNSIVDISNHSPVTNVRNSRRLGQKFNPIELPSMSFNDANLTQTESTPSKSTGPTFSTPRPKTKSKIKEDSVKPLSGAKRSRRELNSIRQLQSLSQTADQTNQFDQSNSILNTTNERVLRPRKNRISYRDLHNGTLDKSTQRK